MAGWNPQPLSPGQHVVTFDGFTIGRVRSVGAFVFEVEQREGPRIWLRNEAVFDADPYRVKLICYADGVAYWCNG
jgi:hypothetical protein